MAKESKLLIWGAGSHSHVIVEQSRYGIPPVISSGIPDSQTFSSFPPEKYSIFIAIGNPVARSKCFKAFDNMNYRMVNIISDRAYISPTAELGRGIYVAPMACIQSHSVIGDGTIVNTHASVDHDCEIGAFCHIAPGVHMGGTVRIGDGSWIGVGSSINDHVSIGKDIMVGSGSVVVEDLIDDGFLFLGSPARKIKEYR
jgi:sugar O-acyltransferase (sialic acid O-acetyltransferase NeuD family)